MKRAVFRYFFFISGVRHYKLIRSARRGWMKYRRN